MRGRVDSEQETGDFEPGEKRNFFLSKLDESSFSAHRVTNVVDETNAV